MLGVNSEKVELCVCGIPAQKTLLLSPAMPEMDLGRAEPTTQGCAPLGLLPVYSFFWPFFPENDMEKEGNTPSSSPVCVLISLWGICRSLPTAPPSKPLFTQPPGFWRP